MTEERVKWILDLIKKYPLHNYGEAVGGSADPWGGSIVWGYDITYNPETDIYHWEDYSEVEGCKFDFVPFQLTETEVIEKLRKINK